MCEMCVCACAHANRTPIEVCEQGQSTTNLYQQGQVCVCVTITLLLSSPPQPQPTTHQCVCDPLRWRLTELIHVARNGRSELVRGLCRPRDAVVCFARDAGQVHDTLPPGLLVQILVAEGGTFGDHSAVAQDIHLCVCVCVCVCVCLCVRMRVCMCVCVCMHNAHSISKNNVVYPDYTAPHTEGVSGPCDGVKASRKCTSRAAGNIR